MKHGKVTSAETTDQGLILATVVVQRAGVTYERCPVAHSFSGESQSLGEGSHVTIDRTDDGLWVVTGVLSTDSDQLPSDLSDQERVISFDDGTEISVRQQNGNYRVSVSSSENISLDAEGDVTINATGNVTIGDAENAQSLAIQSHTHPESGGGTTGTPNESGTSTTVE